MPAAVSPWITTGIALVGAGVIAVAPIAPPAPTVETPRASTPSLAVPAVQLQASVLEIFTFPAFRQYIANQVIYYATWAAGIAGAGVGLGQAIGALPETAVQLTQQLLSLDLLGALTTIETYLIGSLVAVGAPLLDSIITNRERRLAIQLALQSAVPEAIIGVGAAIFSAVDGVLRASIEGGQEVVDAVLTLNLGNIVSALVEATEGFVGSLVDGGQDIVDGIVFAQQTIADALATPPPATMDEEAVDGGSTAFTLATDSDGEQKDSSDSTSATTTDSESPADDEGVGAEDEESGDDGESAEEEPVPDNSQEDSDVSDDLEPESETPETTESPDAGDVGATGGGGQESAESDAPDNERPEAA